MPNDKQQYDLDYRPETYWGQLDELMANIKGQWRRTAIEKALRAGEDVPEHLFSPGLSENVREFIGAIHPMMMGGEYLPDYLLGEVEIARICLASVTGDVISVRARPVGRRIAYRVVDEYWDEKGAQPYVVPWKTSARPLTFRQLIRVFEATQHPWENQPGLLVPIWSTNMESCGWDPVFAHLASFASIESRFYPEVGRWCDDRYLAFVTEYKKCFGEETFPELALLDSSQATRNLLIEEFGMLQNDELAELARRLVEDVPEAGSLREIIACFGPPRRKGYFQELLTAFENKDPKTLARWERWRLKSQKRQQQAEAAADGGSAPNKEVSHG